MSGFPQPAMRVLLICLECRLVHAEIGGWMTKKTYRDITGIHPITCRLKYTYCPRCFDFLITHGRTAYNPAAA